MADTAAVLRAVAAVDSIQLPAVVQAAAFTQVHNPVTAVAFIQVHNPATAVDFILARNPVTAAAFTQAHNLVTAVASTQAPNPVVGTLVPASGILALVWVIITMIRSSFMAAVILGISGITLILCARFIIGTGMLFKLSLVAQKIQSAINSRSLKMATSVTVTKTK